VKVPFLENVIRRVRPGPGLQVKGVHPVGGGCIHEAARVSTTGGDFFVKWNHDCAADVFLSEAAGLRELRAAGSELVVPEVFAASPPDGETPAFIVMEYLPRQPESGALHGTTLGRGLAAVHRCQGDAFGFAVATYCGATRQENAGCSSWVEFYGERRILPLVKMLEGAGRFGAAERRVFDRLRERLPELLPQGPPPSLIHGDLWSGNVMATARGPAVFDPACAYGDREMEFGITTLFGGFAPEFFAAYEEAWPLPAGWRDRNPLYQLYHLLNHSVIFAGGYGPQALSIARRYI
jgi:protein-ribulosamine 3-kinase